MSELALRRWQESDAPALLRLYRAHPDLGRQLPPLAELADARAWITWGLANGNQVFAVTDRGVAVGSVAVTMVDLAHSTGWFHYWLATSHRGRGLAARAAATVADWALTPTDQAGLGLFRLELGHRVNNPASGRVAVAAGFVVEGVERAKLSYEGQRFDVVTMSRLVTDPVPGGERLPLSGQPLVATPEEPAP